MQCSNWTKQNDLPANNALLKAAKVGERAGRVGWVLGFLSGLNVQSGGPIDILKTTSPAMGDEIGRQVDKYCISHPTDVVADAAMSVAKSLFARQAGQ
jgi:hypothetical protein